MSDVLTKDEVDQIAAFTGQPGELIAQGQTVRKIETEYVTAIEVQKPRQLHRVSQRVEDEAQHAGSAFYYRWMVKDKRRKREVEVKGGSIDLAMSVARNFGNCVVKLDMEQETTEHFYLSATFIDLETGYQGNRLFRQRKAQDIGDGYGAERAQDIAFQIGQSKVERNVILRSVPPWIVDNAIEKAMTAELKKITPENIHITRSNILSFFEKYGATEKMLCDYIGRDIEQWTPEDIVDLKGVATGLKEGRVGVKEVFHKDQPESKGLSVGGPLTGEMPPEATTGADPGFQAQTTHGEPELSGPDKEAAFFAKLKWNPLVEKPIARYVDDKKEILKQVAIFYEIDYKGMTAKQLHEHLYAMKNPPSKKDDEGGGAKDPGGAPGSEPPPGASKFTIDLTETDEYIELMSLNEQHPRHFFKVVKGKKPHNVDQCKQWIAEISRRVIEESGGSADGAGGGENGGIPQF